MSAPSNRSPARARRRLAAAVALSAALGIASGLVPSAIFAQSGPSSPGGASAPGASTTSPTPTEPPGSTPTAPGSTPTAPPGSTSPAEGSAVTPCTIASLHLRCPDLIMSAPYNLHMDRTTIPGHVLLRAASALDNRGAGPLEVDAHRARSGSMVVYQAIYDRGGHRHVFRTRAQLVFKYVPGERYEHESVENFSYWKFRHAAAFQLWSIDAQGKAVQLVRTGPKVDYCLRDLIRNHPSPSSPSEPVYPACNRSPDLRRDVLGTSVGWADVYPYEYPEQWIDVTGLRGEFAYVQIANPEGLLLESNRANNISETYVSLPSGRVLGHRVAAATP